MDAPPVSRHYTSFESRQVHYRAAGSGPVLVLIHQSPCNSRELLPLIEFLARDFRVIAPDTPGYGQSDPLCPADSAPGLDEFVDALVRLFDALGLESPAVYGSHSGAIIGVRLAARYPRRVGALVANGVLLNSEAERRELCTHYFEPFLPQWNGSHLAWLWSRIKDQHDYYPWYRRSPQARIHWPAGNREMHSSAMDIMEAGDSYRSAYRAVLDYAISGDLARLAVPTQLLVARPDALSRYVDLYPPLPARVESLVVEDFAAIPGAVRDFFSGHTGAISRAVSGAADAPPATGLRRAFSRWEGAEFHYLQAGEATGRPLLILHDLGLGAGAVGELALALAGPRRVLAPDLPGHGETRVERTAIQPREMAASLAEFLRQLGIEAVDIIAFGAASACALELLQWQPAGAGRLLCCDPLLRESATASGATTLPDLEPDAAGSHLLRGWHYLRDRALFSDWRQRDAAGLRQDANAPGASELQRDLLALLKAKDGLQQRLQAALDYELAAFTAHPAVGFARSSGVTGAESLPPFVALEGRQTHWGSAIEQFFNSPAGDA